MKKLFLFLFIFLFLQPCKGQNIIFDSEKDNDIIIFNILGDNVR